MFVERFQHDGILTNAFVVELFLRLQHQDCSKIYLECLLQRTIESAISNFDLSRYATYIKTLSSRACTPAGPIKAFYECASAHEEGTPSRLLGKIQTQASGLSVEHLKEFLISLLEDLISFVDVSSTEVQECIQSLITTYITGTVGKEPRKPSDWARPEETGSICYKKCDDCSKLKAFLRNPELQHYTLSCKDSWHLKYEHHRFEYFEVDEVDRIPVAVTKTLKWWEEQHRKWETRASNALEALQKLPQDKLKYCLTHRYDEIMDLRVVKVIDDSVESTRQRQPRCQTRSAIPQKRTWDDL